MLLNVARLCYRRRRAVLAAWLVALAAVMVLSHVAGGKDATNFSLPGTESQQAFDLLKAKFPARAGDTGEIVFHASDVRAPAVHQRMEAAFAAARAASPHVTSIVDPYAAPTQISADHTVAYAQLQLDARFNDLPKSTGDSIQTAVRHATGTTAGTGTATPGLDVAFAGNMFTSRTPPGGTEAVGLLAAVVILLIAFGSALAMGLPILMALFGIGIGLGLISLLANFMEVASFTSLIAAMIGIGVGIDYALFIVTRYRQGLHDGMEPEDAVTAAVTTAGRAVLFAGCTVVIALMGMFLMGLSFVNGLAIGAALSVLVTVLGSVTLLPALLGFVGRNIDRFHLPALHRSAATSDRGGFWFSWSRRIQRRPWPFALGALAVLITLGIPVLGLHLGMPDAGNDPKTTTTRQAYDLLSKGFGPGFNGPLTVAASFSHPSDLTTVRRLAADLAADPGVAEVSPPAPNDRVAPTAAVIQVVPRTAPQDAATAKLVRHLRSDVIAPAVRGTDVVVHSGGSAAISIDLAKKLSSRLPYFFGAVIALSFLLLMCVFRSVLVPLKAALMNLLSIGAAFGVLVAIFQWGWGASIIGVSKQPIVAFSPMMLFAILFGLSMDYEVFLLSRVKEEHDRSGDNGLAVADGLAATARVITAAAAIMVMVFFTFLFQSDQTAKLFGLGLGLAILIDATIVRMVLVPATMELLGEANWWLPGWLERILPRLSVDGASIPPPGDAVAVKEEVLSGR